MTASRFMELTREESLRRLASVRVGRIVFTHQALPAIRPVRHLVEDGQVIIRGQGVGPLASALDTVVAYEADALTADEDIGWSVTVTGVARRFDGAPSDGYRDLAAPWTGDDSGYIIRINPELVTGFGWVADGGTVS
jgi:hypothetical protein